jgi:uncharacterized protein
MQSIVSKGKSVKKAISLGLEILETSKEKVNIEIIQHEVKGILGIGSKKAIVKLTKNGHGVDITFDDSIKEKEELKEVWTATLSNILQTDIGQTDRNLAGKVWIKDEKIYFQSSSTYFPMITINHGIKVYRNNEIVNDKTLILSDKDIYDIKADIEQKETSWKVTIDEQKLKVQLHVDPGYKIIRTVKDMEADHHIELIATEKMEIHNTLNYSDIMNKLEDLRVIHGFDLNEVQKAIDASEPSTFDIATGMKPKHGKDGWIEIKVNSETEEEPNDKVDEGVGFSLMKTIPNVEKGQVIGVIHPPLPGEIGYTVTNEPIPAKQTFPIDLKAGYGVTVIDGNIVATESGRPKIVQRGQLVNASIIPKYIHNGDVNLTTGNIRFIGDVEIIGEVVEGTVVEAEENITIHKNVNTAILTSSEAIISYGNIISSDLSAGKNSILLTELGDLLGVINQSLEKIINLIRQLIQSPAFKSSDFSSRGLQPLIRILLEKKFKGFPSLVKKYIEAVTRVEKFLSDDIWRETAVELSHLFLSLSDDVTSLGRIIQLSNKMKELHEISHTPVEQKSYITIPNALNSNLYCNGDVMILGKRCFNTIVHAEGKVKIHGILSGGEVYGKMGVEINEAGAESGALTVISVPYNQKILINKVFYGTTIKIGNVKYTFNETKYHINALLDEDGCIIFD